MFLHSVKEAVNTRHRDLFRRSSGPAKMPRPIVSPSVLASDFGQLTAECTRMIKGGAEWLHMGLSPPFFFNWVRLIELIDVMDG